MNVNSFKTASAKASDADHDWFVIDGENQVVGRLASKVASILRGKHRPDFTPHMDLGDHVIVINADKVRFTGAKETDKRYFRHTGYMGGGKFEAVKDVRGRKPEFIVENAVRGMLPKGTLGRQMFRKLKVYASSSHPHEAQQPKELTL